MNLFHSLKIRTRETIDGNDKAFTTPLVAAPDLRDHGAMVAASYLEELDPIDIPLTYLESFSI